MINPCCWCPTPCKPLSEWWLWKCKYESQRDKLAALQRWRELGFNFGPEWDEGIKKLIEQEEK